MKLKLKYHTRNFAEQNFLNFLQQSYNTFQLFAIT